MVIYPMHLQDFVHLTERVSESDQTPRNIPEILYSMMFVSYSFCRITRRYIKFLFPDAAFRFFFIKPLTWVQL